MKHLFTCLLISLSASAIAQTKAETSQTNTTKTSAVKIETATQPNAVTANPRNAASSAKVSVSPVTPEASLPYDVNDKYMGRKDEFLNMMTVKELPSDFPVYEKQWGVKEYNGVVEAYCMNHMDIMKDRVKQKLQYHINEQKQTK